MVSLRRCIGRVFLPIGFLVVPAGCGDSSPSDPGIEDNTSPSVSILSPADGASLQAGVISLAGTASDAEDGDLSASISWTSGSGLLGSGSSIAATLTAGAYDITASVSDSDGATASASVSITLTAAANQPPTVTITAPGSGTRVAQGTEVTFSATATDPEDGDRAPSISWSSNLDGALGMGARVSTTLSAGTHTVVAAVTDSDGLSDEDTVTVNSIRPVPVPAHIAVVASERTGALTAIDLDADTSFAVGSADCDVRDIAFASSAVILVGCSSSNGRVRVVDLATGTITDTLAHSGAWLTTSPDGGTAFVCCEVGQNLLAATRLGVIELSSLSIVDEVDLVYGGTGAPRFSPDGTLAYVGSGEIFDNRDVIQAIDVSSRTVTDSLMVGDTVSFYQDGAISPDGSRGYFSYVGGPESVIVGVDLATGMRSSSSKNEVAAVSLAVNAAGDELWAGGYIAAGSSSGSGILVLDATSLTPLDTLAIGSAVQDIAMTPDGSRLLAATTTNELLIFDVATRSQLTAVAVPNPVVVSVPIH